MLVLRRECADVGYKSVGTITCSAQRCNYAAQELEMMVVYQLVYTGTD